MSANADQLKQVNDEVVSCPKCPLAKTRCKAVPGEGSPQALVMFIGEAPGKNEDLQGRPFVGDAGKLLEALLKAIDLRREDVFIANVVKCRPPGNRDPHPVEIEACKNYLDRQIAAINPRLIVTLGRISMARYFPGKLISQIHGQYKVEGGRIVLPMYHPAAALRDQNGRGPTMAKFKEDGLTIPELLEKAKEIARTEIWGVGFAEPEEAASIVGPVAAADAVVEVVATQPTSVISPVQPTLQPSTDTRPGEVAPMERIAPPEPPLKPVRRTKNTVVETVPVAIDETHNITSSELADRNPDVNAQAKQVEITPKRQRKIKTANSQTEEEATNNQSEILELVNPRRNGAARRKRKESTAQAEQLTLF